MHKQVLCLMALGAIAAASCASAQQSSHPKVLQVTREFLKPYKGGELHDKTESAFVSALTAAHWPTHYLALNSLSGKSRALYFTTYDSFDAWEKDTAAMMKNATLSAALEKLSHADGELLEAVDQGVYYYDEDLSYKSSNDIGHMRFIEATVFRIKPGHGKDFSDLAKLAIDGHKKAGDSAHWSMWELAYGGEDNTYVMLSGDKNMAEIDTGYSEDKAFHDALGEDGMKKLHELAAQCIISTDSELFAINPKQSYAKDEWVQADPAFWKPAPAMKAIKAVPPTPVSVGQRPPQ